MTTTISQNLQQYIKDSMMHFVEVYIML